MKTETRERQNSIEPRTRRAAEESMTVVPEGDGEYTVFSGETSEYTVDIGTGECDCPDQKYNVGPGECKHARRVEMETGRRPIPDLPGRLDVEVMVTARQRVLLAAQAVAIPDGGQVTETCENGQEGCCGPQGEELPCFECYQEADR